MSPTQSLDGSEFEIGSIGIQHGEAWAWGIDTVIPMRVLETQGKGKNRRDCMQQFRAAWDPADEANDGVRQGEAEGR